VADIYIIERYWFDTMENRNADGWKPIGIVTSKEEADRIVELKKYEVKKHPWPLKFAVAEGEEYVPAFRYKDVALLDGLDLLTLEKI